MVKKAISTKELESLNQTECTGGRGRLSHYNLVPDDTKITVKSKSVSTANNRIYNYNQLKDFITSNLVCKTCKSNIVIDEDTYLIASSLKFTCSC